MHTEIKKKIDQKLNNRINKGYDYAFFSFHDRIQLILNNYL